MPRLNATVHRRGPTVVLAGDADAALRGLRRGADEWCARASTMEIARVSKPCFVARSRLVVIPKSLPARQRSRRMRAGLARSAVFQVLADSIIQGINDAFLLRRQRVIRILAKIMHDVVKGVCGEGRLRRPYRSDDFIFVIRPPTSRRCTEIVSRLDTIIHVILGAGRRSGIFFGKDRRGQFTVSLMTVAIGVVTTTGATHARRPGERARHRMKSYERRFRVGVYVDSRTDSNGRCQPHSVQ